MYPRGMSPTDPQRIAKLLARAGVASRREVERMIAEGRVALAGQTLATPATVLTSLAGVTVDGQPVAAAEPARLFLYHKPVGLLVTERDPGGRPTIYDRLPTTLPRVVPVGRLDLNTEGLLLLTTDGGLKRQLELPATGVGRTYRARCYGSVTQARLEELIEGVEIEGVRYGSIDANLERRTGANVWIELTLTEGKNREVRRVLEHLGLRVSRLIRTRYGPFVLGDLPAGEVGEVHARDLDAFQKNPTRAPPKLRERTAPDRSPEVRVPRPNSAPARSAPSAPERATRSFPARGGVPSGPPPRAREDQRRPGLAREATPAKPARAARAAAHRQQREPRPGELVDKPRGKGPAGGRGRPAKPARPPRTRK